MWLLITQNFKDDRDEFFKKEVRFIKDMDRAKRFISNGWAEDKSKPGVSGEPFVGEVDLEVQPGKIGMRDTYDG